MSEIGLFVINYNGHSKLSTLFMQVLENLNSLNGKLDQKIDIWIVDNASTDSSIKTVLKYKNLRLIELNKNFGYGVACNLAYLITKKKGYNYKLLVFMNNDMLLFHEQVNSLINIIRKMWKQFNGNFLATALFLNGYDSKIDYGGSFIDNIGNTWSLRIITDDPKFIYRYAKYLGIIEIHYADGAFLIIPSKIFEMLGGFSQQYFMYLEDVDLSFKAHMLNVRVLLIPIIIGIHYRSSSFGSTGSITFYYVIRNTIYVVFKYFGFVSFLKTLLFYSNYFIFSLLRMSFNLYNKFKPSNLNMKQKFNLFTFALKALIDAIKIWKKEKIKYILPKKSYFNIPLGALLSPRLYKTYIQESVLQQILSSRLEFSDKKDKITKSL